jgi:hypothetical protein
MEQLPFKIHNRKPKVIYVGKDVEVPPIVEKERMGTDALVYKGNIYTFQKKIPVETLEHEKAHCRAEPSHVVSPKGVVAWLDDEVRADLLTYKETGRPERIFDRLNSRASDARVYHLQDGVNYNYYEQTKHTLEHIEEIYRKYWDYLPDQWKKDYVKFMEHSGKKLERLRLEGKNCNPPKDYYVRWLRKGDYDVKKKRVYGKRDEVTGFVVRKVRE